MISGFVRSSSLLVLSMVVYFTLRDIKCYSTLVLYVCLDPSYSTLYNVSATFTEETVHCAEWVTCDGMHYLFPYSYGLGLLYIIRCSCLLYDAEMFSVYMLDTH